MSETKQFTATDALSIIDFSKDFDYQDVDSETILLDWKLNRSNTIREEDEHGLSVVGIFEHPITLKGKEVGKIILFNYTGVGGGWHNDIYNMVEEKYFGKDEYYRFEYGDNDAFYYRLFFVGNNVFDTDKYEKYKKINKLRIHEEKLSKGLVKIVYDWTQEESGEYKEKSMDAAIELREKLRADKDCAFFYSGAITAYVKSIDQLKYKPAKPIVEKRIKERKK